MPDTFCLTRPCHLQDTEQLISRHDLDDYIIASLSLYLDILNLFMKASPRGGSELGSAGHRSLNLQKRIDVLNRMSACASLTQPALASLPSRDLWLSRPCEAADCARLCWSAQGSY